MVYQITLVMEINPSASTAANEQVFESSAIPSIGRRFASGFMDFFLAFTIAYVVPFIGPLLCIIYLLNKDAFPFLQGQSIGKKLLQTRAVKLSNGKAITKDYSASILRSVTLLIPGLNVIEVIRLILNKERLGDIWAGTLVVKD